MARYLVHPDAYKVDFWDGVASGLHRIAPFAIALLALVAIAAIAVIATRTWSRQKLQCNAQFVAVSLPSKVEPSGAEVLWTNLHDILHPTWKRFLFGQSHLSFETKWSTDGIQIGIWVPKTVSAHHVTQVVEAAWPGTRTEIFKADDQSSTENATIKGGELRLKEPEWFPIKTDHDADPMRAIFGAVGSLREDQQTIVQVLARPVTGRRLSKGHRAARALRSGKNVPLLERVLDPKAPGVNLVVVPDDPNRSSDIRAILAKISTPGWEVRIRYAVSTQASKRYADGELKSRAHALASAFALFSGRNRLARCRARTTSKSLLARCLGSGDLFSTPELAAVAHLPFDQSVPGIERAGSRSVAPIPRLPRTGKVIGDSDAGVLRPVAVDPADFPYHFHVMGSTGVGKSTLLTNMVLDDVKVGRGAIVIDPKGDLITDILSRLEPSMANKLVLFDPANAAGTPGMNVLEGTNVDLVVDNIVGIFRRIFEAYWGPRTDDLLRSACLTLLSDGTPTLADVPKILTDTGFRHHYVRKLRSGSGLAGFWSWYDDMSEAQRAQLIGPVMNKLRAFLLRDFVRNIVGVKKSDFDMNAVLNGGLLLVRLPKGSLGTETTKLLGSLVVARVWQTVLARIEEDPTARLSTSLYVDECHNFLNLPIGVDEMLAEARGYGLSLVLAHQHLGQLNREMRDAISSNARNKVFFTMSPEDAYVLERHVKPELLAYDLSHLGGYQVAARLMANGKPAPVCTLATRPAVPAASGRLKQMRDAVMERRAKNRPKDTQAEHEHSAEETAPVSAYGSAPASGPAFTSGDPEQVEHAGSGGSVLPGSIPRLTEENQ